MHDPYTLVCKARPSFDGCGTSLSVSLSLSLSSYCEARLLGVCRKEASTFFFRIVGHRSAEHQRLQLDSYEGVQHPETKPPGIFGRFVQVFQTPSPSPTAPSTSSRPGSLRSWRFWVPCTKEQSLLDLTSAGFCGEPRFQVSRKG